MTTNSVQVPAQTLERLRNWQRSVDLLTVMIQATVDALCEAQGLPPDAQIALQRGVWVAPPAGAQDGASDSTQEG